MKKQIQGGVDSVRVVPMNFQQGGALDLSTPPPKSINLPISFNEGGNVDSLMPRFDQFSPEQKQQLDEEIYRKHFFDMLNEHFRNEERNSDPYFQQEQEKYKREFLGLPNIINAGGIMNVPSPNFSQENNLKPAGILSINKVYDI
jgi:hypothetical protein